MKTISVDFSEEAQKVYDYLINMAFISKTERMILNAIDQKVGFIKLNPYFGDVLAKKLIPKEYKPKYNIKNLFRVELPCFWRMLYTIRGEKLR